MEEDEEAHIITIEEQFFEFSRLLDHERDGTTMTLYRSDYWLRQAKIINDRSVTMMDTGIAWWKFSKTELTLQEWVEFLQDLCNCKELDFEEVQAALCSCGLPGLVAVHVPQYKDFFDTYQPKNRLIDTGDVDN